MLDLKGFYPIVTAGSRYSVSRGGERKITAERTLEVELPILEEEPTLKELEAFDFGEAGEIIADSVAVLFAFYLAARHAPLSA